MLVSPPCEDEREALRAVCRLVAAVPPGAPVHLSQRRPHLFYWSGKRVVVGEHWLYRWRLAGGCYTPVDAARVAMRDVVR